MFNQAVMRGPFETVTRDCAASLARAERQIADALQAAGMPGQAADLANSLRAGADARPRVADATGDADLNGPAMPT